jgi:hypothetical protein
MNSMTLTSRHYLVTCVINKRNPTCNIFVGFLFSPCVVFRLLNKYLITIISNFSFNLLSRLLMFQKHLSFQWLDSLNICIVEFPFLATQMGYFDLNCFLSFSFIIRFTSNKTWLLSISLKHSSQITSNSKCWISVSHFILIITTCKYNNNLALKKVIKKWWFFKCWSTLLELKFVCNTHLFINILFM